MQPRWQDALIRQDRHAREHLAAGAAVASTIREALRAAAGPVAVKRRIATILLPLWLAACAQSATYGHAINNAKLIAVTSPIPGAQAKVLPATADNPNAPATSHFCVTDAGYCPLAAAAAPGLNCLCQTGTLVYGGATGVPPPTYVPDGQ